MKIVVVDARMVGPTLHGIARYVTLMARGLLKSRQAGYETVFLVRPGMENSEHFKEFRTHVVQAPFLAMSEQKEIRAALTALRADLYHSPSFSSLLKSPCPWIVTVHDLNHLTYGGFKEKLYYRLVLKPFVRKARALLTVSEFSKTELDAWSGRKSEVVYNALEEAHSVRPGAEELRSTLSRFGLEPGRYFFSLSNAKPHKNIGFLVDAYASYRSQKGPGVAWPLVLSLKDFDSVDGVRGIGALGDSDARMILAGAGALVFPSLYEGFGLPPLEAALAGTRVVVSNIPAHREALRDLGPAEALWVGPTDHHGWVQAFHGTQAEQFSAPSRDSARAILQRYSVDRLGETMDRIYRRVLGL